MAGYPDDALNTMSFFHTHDLEFVGRTYAQPTNEYVSQVGISMLVYQQLTQGCTTYIWKCSDPNCDKIVKTEALGKQEGVL